MISPLQPKILTEHRVENDFLIGRLHRYLQLDAGIHRGVRCEKDRQESREELNLALMHKILFLYCQVHDNTGEQRPGRQDPRGGRLHRGNPVHFFPIDLRSRKVVQQQQRFNPFGRLETYTIEPGLYKDHACR